MQYLSKSFSVSLSSPDFSANYDRIFRRPKKTAKKPKPKKVAK